MNYQKLKRKLRSAFSKEDMLITLDLVDISITTKWRYKGSLRGWIDKCLYYKSRYGEPHMISKKLFQESLK